MRLTPATELEYRCKKLQDQMILTNLDAVIIVQNADLFYFTGTVQSGCLYLPASGQPLFLVRKDAGRARMESGLKEVIPCNSLRDIPARIADYGYPPPGTLPWNLMFSPVRYWSVIEPCFPVRSFPMAHH